MRCWPANITLPAHVGKHTPGSGGGGGYRRHGLCLLASRVPTPPRTAVGSDFIPSSSTQDLPLCHLPAACMGRVFRCNLDTASFLLCWYFYSSEGNIEINNEGYFGSLKENEILLYA